MNTHTHVPTLTTITVATLPDTARNTIDTSIYLSSVNCTRHATISASPSRQRVYFTHACCIYVYIKYVCVYACVYVCMSLSL